MSEWTVTRCQDCLACWIGRSRLGHADCICALSLAVVRKGQAPVEVPPDCLLRTGPMTLRLADDLLTVAIGVPGPVAADPPEE